MTDREPLPYVVDLWAEDELSVRCLARAAERSIARMAFDAAAVSYPHRVITLRGPGMNEAHQPAMGEARANSGAPKQGCVLRAAPLGPS